MKKYARILGLAVIFSTVVSPAFAENQGWFSRAKNFGKECVSSETAETVFNLCVGVAACALSYSCIRSAGNDLGDANSRFIKLGLGVYFGGKGLSKFVFPVIFAPLPYVVLYMIFRDEK